MAIGPNVVRWSNETGFVLATAAAAVGLGNLWRFPYVAGENGGAAFVIAYLLAVVVVGIPLMVLEISAGRAERGSPVRTFRSIYKPASVLGWGIVLLTVIIMSYYLVITGWTLGFAVEAVQGNLISFEGFTDGYITLLYFAIVALITGVVVARGVSAIEVLSKFMMPILITIVIILTVNSLTMEGRGEALQFLFNPDFSLWRSPTLWLLAFGQAFYSLAVGQGYLITYGSFLPRTVNLPRASGMVALIETGIAILAGLMMFPIVFSFQELDPGEGTELAFTTLPLAFEQMGAWGGLLGAVFFVLFFVAAISSCIAGMEVVKNAVKEEFQVSSVVATLISFIPIIPLGILSALSFTPLEVEVLGRPFLDVLDLFAANQIVVTSGILGGAVISWCISREDLINGFGTRWYKLAWWTVTAARYLPIPALLLVALSFIF